MKLSLFFLPTYRPKVSGPVSRFYNEIFEEVEFADAAGFDRVWFAEHHFFAYGGTMPSASMMGLAAALRTKRIRIGSGVALITLNDPIRVAEEFAMLDVMSGGRLDFGIGRAFQRVEYDAFNVPMEQSRDRFNEAHEIIIRAWSDEPVSFNGKFKNLSNVNVMPKPIQRPHPPISVACIFSEESFRFAGSHGYDLMFVPYVTDREGGMQRMEWYREALRKAGHDPSAHDIMMPLHFYCGENPTQARDYPHPYLSDYLAAASDANQSDANPSQYANYAGIGNAFAALSSNYEMMYPHNVVFGDPEGCLKRLEELAEFGATEVSLVSNFGAMPHREVMRSLERFAKSVMPHVGRSGHPAAAG